MLSPQQLLTCNYMNEGCDGGWPHFNIILAENANLVSEQCAPYKQVTKGDQCHRYEQCAPKAKIAESYQVGGGWGATSERRLMKEISVTDPSMATSRRLASSPSTGMASSPRRD